VGFATIAITDSKTHLSTSVPPLAACLLFDADEVWVLIPLEFGGIAQKYSIFPTFEILQGSSWILGGAVIILFV
jgi:hypothetical protein